MPRFPVAFGKRKQATHSDNSQNGPQGEAPSSFRVLDRSEVTSGKGSIDGFQLERPGMTTAPLPKSSLSIESYSENNLFADLHYNRGSGASNTTKATASTDNSSRHSNASTTPSSADLASHEEMRNGKKPFSDVPLPPVPKTSSGWSLKSASRTFSFGGQKKHALPTVPSEPTDSEHDFTGRARSKTASTSTTSTTATPPTLNGEEFDLNLGGDFSGMFKGSGFDKRASVMTLRQHHQQQQQPVDDRQALAPRSLTGNRLNQPAPIQIDRTSRVEESPYSWNSQHSGDHLISSSPIQSSPTNENAPPPVPQHGTLPSRLPRTNTDTGLKRSSAVFGRRRSTEPAEAAEADDEDALLLKQSIAASKFLTNPPPPPPASGRYRRNEETFGSRSRQVSSESRMDPKKDDEDNMFDSSIAHSSRMAQRFINRKPSPPHNKVMTPAQFEKYRQDKERQEIAPEAKNDNSDDDVNYEDEDDEIERSKEMAKQRRKQEAHMAVYRQQMMKVTGESNPPPSVSASMSTPNLTLSVTPPVPSGPSENSDEDEEVPLAILAAHGFPNRNRPPNRLSSMMSNPNLRASMAPSVQRPESVAEGSIQGGQPSQPGPGARLPPFARRLPQDPYGIVNNSVRESIHMGGGAPAPGGPGGSLPPGGLVGVIANEERTRAMRRGSPKIDGQIQMGQGGFMNGGGYDPMAGMPQQMMFPQQPMMTPGEMQMNQQMQQFMQMQMQFMQMMSGQQNASQMGAPMGPQMGGGLPPNSHMPANSMGDIQRRSFLDPGAGYDPARSDAGMRTMSMVHPSSSSFYGQPMGPGAPSIHIQGQYAASIAPSERSNIGLPGRYRPVSHLPPPDPMQQQRRVSTMSGALGIPTPPPGASTSPKPSGRPSNEEDDDDEQGWEQMRAKRERRKTLWKSKKSFGAELGALIS
ncbi:hypothetical protein MKZ38_010308 [Zalerion maritima]|uniref:Uncharacterized protein n=1 Tax=Zalerion maritima TaxID=339359 RepID=A0AAD5RTM2_9PEZI|nr:hypothetical protein MKZ38_010308 [Zalerion maritima]